MTGNSTSGLWRCKAIDKKRRVSHNGVKLRFRFEILQRRNVNVNSAGIRRSRDIFSSLSCCKWVNFHPFYIRLWKTLSHHQGYDTCACANIKYMLPSISPCAKHNTVCTNFHGAAFLAYSKVSEFKFLSHTFQTSTCMFLFYSSYLCIDIFLT